MPDKEVIERCRKTSLRVRRQVIEMAYGTGRTGAHLGGSLSSVEILSCLYGEVLRVDPSDPSLEDRDRFILSKGHAAMALYPAMSVAGLIETEELATFKQDGSRIGGHPSLNGLPGIEFASGSLGQGLSQGVGVCLALKRKGNERSRCYVLMGDGEIDEGSVWEAAASASHFHLDNLIAIVDTNGIQYDGATSEVLAMDPLEDKWRAFGWETAVIDGHDVAQVLEAFAVRTNRPLAIIARTVKGKGVSFMEGDPKWHNSALTREQYEQAISELEVA